MTSRSEQPASKTPFASAMPGSDSPVTQQEIVSAINHHARELARLTATWPAAEPPVALNEHPECQDLAHSELMRRLPNVPPHLLAEIQQLSPWALQRRVLIQADWLGSYSRCLDGLGLKEGVDTCWNPRDIRRAVENLRPSVPPTDAYKLVVSAGRDLLAKARSCLFVFTGEDFDVGDQTEAAELVEEINAFLDLTPSATKDATP